MSHDALVGVTRASKALGLCERTIRKAIAAGELPTCRLRVVDVRAWIERHRVRP